MNKIFPIIIFSFILLESLALSEISDKMGTLEDLYISIAKSIMIGASLFLALAWRKNLLTKLLIIVYFIVGIIVPILAHDPYFDSLVYVEFNKKYYFMYKVLPWSFLISSIPGIFYLIYSSTKKG